MLRTCLAASVALLLLALLAPPSFAVEPSSDIPLDELELRLEPLRKGEFENTKSADGADENGVVENWMEALRSSVEAGAQAQLGMRTAKDEAAKAQLSDQVAKLTIDRKALLERVEVVLGAWEAKGGDPAEQRKYIAAVGNVQADLIESKGLMTFVMAWLKSEEGGLALLKKIGLFLLVLFGFRIAANVVGNIVRRALSKLGNTPELLRNFLANTARNVITIIGLVVALSMLGVDIGPMLAAIGGAGFVIGFALQSTLSNFAAGVMILMYRPYEIGDVVTVAGVTGKVTAMTLVSTTVMTLDNQVIVVPNSNIWGGVIQNATGSDTRRVDMVFGIGYDDDMAKAQAILEELASGHPKVLAQPEPVVKVGTLNASSVDYIVRPWCKTEDYWDVYWDLTRQVKERFDAEGISIPYPQTDIHIHQADPA